tara:strand:- start:153 stop:704 length:552 start_codon:yes stop_codon:yes gene_type:complete
MQENKFTYTKIIEAGIWKSFIEDLDTEYWIKSLYNYQTQFPKGEFKSNFGGYQSKNNLHNFKTFYPLVNQLNNFIISFFENPNTKLISMWGNISPPNSYNLPHTHFHDITTYNNTDISGVLYLKVPKDSGNIMFYNPLYISNQHSIETQPKDIILFHQHLPHSVNPNFSQEDRISIAFNFDKI